MLIPPANHPAREYFDLPSLVDMLAPANRAALPTLQEAIRTAKRTCATPGVKAVGIVVLHADDAIRLWRFGPRGGRKLLWTFRQPSC